MVRKRILFLTLMLVLTMLKIYSVEIDGINYELNANQTAEVTHGSTLYSYSGSIIIPSQVTYNGEPYSVTSIGVAAFSVCSSLTSITIPESVTSIGESAFRRCSGLTSINIPKGVTSIGDDAFLECSGLTSITIPESVTSIGRRAFYYCSDLTSITIPESVTSIGNYAFSGCSGLSSITVQEGNSVYDSRYNCNAIIQTANNTLIAGCKNTTIPNGITSIGDRAFLDCSDLSSITIPESVTSIGNSAFNGCQLETVLAKNPLTIFTGSGAFSSRTFQHAMLYIPLGTWRQAIYNGDWYQFINIREVTMSSQSLSQARAYTMMNAQDFGYAIYNKVDDAVSFVNAFYNVNEDDPSNSWQIIEQADGKSVMNIGSKKYLNVLANGELSMSDSPVLLNVSDTENGITINGTESEWMFVTNNKVSTNNITKVEVRKEISIESGEFYSLDGVLMSEPIEGINIIRTQDGTVKKVIK